MEVTLIAKPSELSKLDLEILKVLHSACFGECPVPDWEEDYWWYLKDQEVIIGFAGMTIVEGDSEDLVGTFTRAGVLPGWRGQGLQKKLIKTRLKYAKKHDCVRCTTYTSDNPASENSLISCGFRRYNPESRWAGEEMTYWRHVF